MFNPSQDQVREFFCGCYQKYVAKLPASALETMAIEWIQRHPEYHEDLKDIDQAKLATYPPEAGRTNPFLHLSMHLSIDEQISIDQPVGIRALVQRLQHHLNDPHEAAHRVMDCLGQTIWTAQKTGQAPDSAGYLDCLRRQLSKD